jgi:hypothetical protein
MYAAVRKAPATRAPMQPMRSIRYGPSSEAASARRMASFEKKPEKSGKPAMASVAMIQVQ